MRIASKHEFCGTFALGGHEKCRVNRIVFVPVTLREEISERIYLLYRVNSVHIHQKARWNVVDFCGTNPHASVDGKIDENGKLRADTRTNPHASVDGKAGLIIAYSLSDEPIRTQMWMGSGVSSV